MSEIVILISIITCIICVCEFVYVLDLSRKQKEVYKTLNTQNNIIIKLQNALKNKVSINETTDKAEIIYQDLLQHL
ncbi:MAG: hypothetical protein MJ156_02975, partial [Alphaproteobacteria bacterium]|nr:hypothetical protein [Alphaproteobacteria bacterium]